MIKRDKPNTPLSIRLLGKSQYDAKTGCWVWLAGVQGGDASFPYGSIKVNGRSRAAHKAAYETFSGPVPKGLCVCHTCDNSRCINPAHLFVGTHADNHTDRNAKGRQAKGETNGRAKLTEEKVREIRRTVIKGHPVHGIGATAVRYSVDHAVIRRVIERKSWRHVTDLVESITSPGRE